MYVTKLVAVLNLRHTIPRHHHVSIGAVLHDIAVICVLDPWISRQKAASGGRAIIDTALEAWPKHTWLQDSHVLGILCLHEGWVFSWLDGCNLTLTTLVNLDLLARPIERLWLGSVTNRAIVIAVVRVML